MITGKDLLERGWSEGPAIGKALSLARGYDAMGVGDESVLNILCDVRANPADYLDLEDGHADLAHYFGRSVAPDDRLRDEPLHFPVWGRDGIDDKTIEQMNLAMRLPITVSGALMPDAHLGYGLPVGGVLATKGAVIPYAVGFDIGCRMRLTVTDVPATNLVRYRNSLVRTLVHHTYFGAGVTSEGHFDHPIMHDPRWESTRLLLDLKHTAARQLGTSGSGNHFVEWGVYRANWNSSPVLALLSHSGSRGLGHKIATHYSRVAAQEHPDLKGDARNLAWLDIRSDAGQEYWNAMCLAGDYAAANHEVIHNNVLFHCAMYPREVALVVENFHNFAWYETVMTADGPVGAVVHRKGATPAGLGVKGIIPGSMGDCAFVVSGKGVDASLNSASHGAGRAMSRTRARQTISRLDHQRYMAENGVCVIGGGIDESPLAYKRIGEVMDAQRDLVLLDGVFMPQIVRMDDGHEDI